MKMNIPLVLASSSPRRRELLTQAGFELNIIPPEIDETPPEWLPPLQLPQYLSRLKAESVFNKLKQPALVIGADTIVVLNNKIYNKPSVRDEAIKMLSELSGKTHEVITGVTLKTVNKEHQFSVTTRVSFYPLTLSDIEWYVENFKPFDKAGSYAIQEWIGLNGIEKIEGCYFNVVGLPVGRLKVELMKFMDIQ